MKNIIVVVAGVLAILLGLLGWFAKQTIQRQHDDILRLESNIRALTTEISKGKSTDGKETSTTLQKTLTKAEIKELLHAELATLDIKPKDVNAATVISSENHTKVKLDTIIVHDTVKQYQFYDDWLQITVKDDSATISVFDSILVVNHAKTRKFLWWTWKRYSGKTTIKNYSPYSTIRTIEAIQIDKQ